MGPLSAAASDAPPPALRSWTPEPFRPSLWALSPHAQTVAGKYLRPELPLDFRRETWRTPDGDELVLDFAPEPARGHGGEGRAEAPLVVVLHGLEGDARRRYARMLYRELARRGIAAVGLNFRGCAGPNRTARAYHSGETGDLRFVLERLRSRDPSRRLAAVGFSLGGNVLLKLLGEMRMDAREWLAAAVAVSVPYDLEAGARCLEETPMGRRYGRYFLDSLVEKVRDKRHLLEGRIDVDAALLSKTIRLFDDRVTAPLHGFRDARHYYAESSSGPRVGDVRVPTLLLHATDDPFLPADRFPLEAARANPFVLPVLTERGGHVGFVEGPPWAPRFWAERQAASFLRAALSDHGDGGLLDLRRRIG